MGDFMSKAKLLRQAEIALFEWCERMAMRRMVARLRLICK
jgi:hypothetical protein